MRPVSLLDHRDDSPDMRAKREHWRDVWACRYENLLAAWQFDENGTLRRVRDDNYPEIRTMIAQDRRK